MNKELKKDIIKIGFSFIVTLAVIVFLFPQLMGAGGISNSPCDKYTNSTSSAIKYMLGKCYIPTYSYYETNEVCRGGFIGIGQSCYESSKTHYESVRGYRCVVTKTGEEC